MGCQRGRGGRKKLAPARVLANPTIDQDREACARRTEEGWGWVRLGRGGVARGSGEARTVVDRAEAPCARVRPATARSRRGTGGQARPRRAWPPRTGAVTSSASRRRAPSGRGRRGEGGEGGLPSWTIGARACRLRSRRGRREREVAARGAGGCVERAGGVLNRRTGERPVPDARFVAQRDIRKFGGEFRLDVVRILGIY